MDTTAPALPSDRQLVDAVRRGSDAAWGELVARHVHALRTLARGRAVRRRFELGLVDLRERIVESWEGTEGEPSVRAFRPLVLSLIFGGGYGPAGPVRPADDPDGAELLATAFARLPEPWQTVLWHRFVEGLDDDSIAPLVGRSPSEVPALVATARRGLADAFLLECEGAVTSGADVGPLEDVIDGHLAAVIAPRLSGHTVVDHRRAVARGRHPRRRLSARML